MPRIAVVTGGASGIGAALCRALDRRGAHVVVADVDGDGARALATTLARAEPAELDVRDGAAVAALLDDVVARHGRLDLVAANAGIGVGGDTGDLGLDHWDRVVDVNLRGVVHCVAAAWPHMVAQGHGRLLTTASLAGLVPVPGLAAYSMTKHGVVGLSLSLRQEAAAHGIGVTVLCPGAVDTPILSSTGPVDLPPIASMQGLDGRALLGRVVPLHDADALAEQAMRGLARDAAVVVAPASARALVGLRRVAPGLVDRVLARAFDVAGRAGLR